MTWTLELTRLYGQTEGGTVFKMSCVSLAGHEQHSNFPPVWTVRVNGLANGGTWTCAATISWRVCHLSASASRMSISNSDMAGKSASE